MRQSSTEHVAAILNAAWWVRNYSPRQKTRRSQAILHLGLVVRESFNQTDDFEALLEAVVDGLRPKDPRPF